MMTTTINNSTKEKPFCLFIMSPRLKSGPTFPIDKLPDGGVTAIVVPLVDIAVQSFMGRKWATIPRDYDQRGEQRINRVLHELRD